MTIGCSSNNNLNSGNGDGGGDGGGQQQSQDLSAGIDLGGPGAACTTACDCMPGLACNMGMCEQDPQGAIYCCESGMCPTGDFCQSQAGDFMMCGAVGRDGGMMGRRDGGGFGGRDGGGLGGRDGGGGRRDM
jgi:hypothetical protein